MEKRTPHCPLAVVKKLVEAGKVDITRTAVRDGAGLGFAPHEIVAVVLAISMADFYKSMTTHSDHRVWQDVYRPRTRVGDVYLKLTVIDEVLIVSFKPL